MRVLCQAEFLLQGSLLQGSLLHGNPLQGRRIDTEIRYPIFRSYSEINIITLPLDADALFPDLTFLKLLFGHRSLAELEESRADLYARNAEAAVLLDALFPKKPSNVVGLG